MYIIYIYIYIYNIYMFIYIYGKRNLREMATSVCLRKGKNGNCKLPFVFLSRQTINGNRLVLFQQTCPSIFFRVALYQSS